MIQTNSRIISSLGLGKMTDSGLSDYAADRVMDLTKHALDFPNLKPSATDILTVLDLYNTARNAGGEVSPSNTNAKNVLRFQLENKLNQAAGGCSL